MIDWFAEFPGKGAILICAPSDAIPAWTLIQIKNQKTPLYHKQSFNTLEAAVGYVDLML